MVRRGLNRRGTPARSGGGVPRAASAGGGAGRAGGRGWRGWGRRLAGARKGARPGLAWRVRGRHVLQQRRGRGVCSARAASTRRRQRDQSPGRPRQGRPTHRRRAVVGPPMPQSAVGPMHTSKRSSSAATVSAMGSLRHAAPVTSTSVHTLRAAGAPSTGAIAACRQGPRAACASRRADGEGRRGRPTTGAAGSALEPARRDGGAPRRARAVGPQTRTRRREWRSRVLRGGGRDPLPPRREVGAGGVAGRSRIGGWHRRRDVDRVGRSRSRRPRSLSRRGRLRRRPWPRPAPGPGAPAPLNDSA